MRVAVLTLTRDRLAYTRHCFQTLRDNAGCDFDHLVLDNASTDGTVDWLEGEYHPHILAQLGSNIGICRGLNVLLGSIDPADYDVIVRFDNDCEVTRPGTLRAVCEVAHEYEAIVAPHVLRLLNPPIVIGQAIAGRHVIDQTAILGGIFMAIPATLFSQHGFRYDENMPPWTGDEAIVPWWRARGGVAGYLAGWTVNHYERVAEQHEELPEYQARKEQEMAA